MPFVLDNSVVTGWYLSDQATQDAQLRDAAVAAGIAVL
jgi:hypothetical protein